ncbi:MAG: CZB domain-containing protein [Nitrospirae bacterium]|nr:CZB domain-containing protein [Nitrospirota bacterium]
MKISTAVIIMVASLIVFVLGSGLFLRSQLSGMMDDGRVVNFAGKIRGGSQRLIKLEFASKHGEADKAIENIDKYINGLINGDSSLKLPKATDESFVTQLKRVEVSWKSLRQSVLDSRKDASLSGKVMRESEEFFELTREFTSSAENLSAHNVDTIRTSQIVFISLNIMILCAALYATRAKVLRPLKLLSGQIESMVNKNLRVSVKYESKDEIGYLVNDINKLIDFFNDVVNNTIVSINNVVSTMDLVRTKTDGTVEGAKQQYSQALQIATAAEQMSQTITDIAINASKATETSSNAMAIAEKGKEIALGALGTVNSVHSTTSELSSLIGTLNMRVTEIGDILQVINDIADQTNLLALNAAIEAARAGEQGRGFAVVADEVRKLAERTKTATTEISGKINAVQSESGRTTASMQSASLEVSKTTELMNQVGEVLREIVNANRDVRDQITTIAVSVDEQSATADEVAKNVEKTSGIARTMEQESHSVMKEINKMISSAEELRKSTTGFKTKGSELLVLDLAKTDHRLWVNRVSFCIKGAENIDPNTLLDHTACRLGKWYYSEGKDLCGHMQCYQKIEGPHKKLHALGKDIVTIFNGGNEARAKELFVELESLSGDIIGALNETKSGMSLPQGAQA